MSLEKIINTDKVRLSTMGDEVTIPADMWVDLLDYTQTLEDAHRAQINTANELLEKIRKQNDTP